MKDEIKEILDNIQTVIDEGHYRATCDIDYEDCKLLLDCITNLQEENEKIKKYYNDNVNKYEDLLVKYSTIERWYQLNKLRHEKVLELLKNLTFYTTPTGEVIHLQEKINSINKAINILQGEDKDVKR